MFVETAKKVSAQKLSHSHRLPANPCTASGGEVRCAHAVATGAMEDTDGLTRFKIPKGFDTVQNSKGVASSTLTIVRLECCATNKEAGVPRCK